MKLLKGLSSALFVILLAACGADKQDAHAPSHKQAFIPKLDAQLKVEGNTAIVTVTTDLHISPEHYGEARHEGEGHIHMYLDGGEKIGVKKHTHEIPDLSKGPHVLKVSLHNNDHTPYDVTKVIEFEVK